MTILTTCSQINHFKNTNLANLGQKVQLKPLVTNQKFKETRNLILKSQKCRNLQKILPNKRKRRDLILC